MQTVTLHEAETHFYHLLEAVDRGEEFIIVHDGQPIATLTAYKPPRRKIAPPGSMEGQGWCMNDDFNEPMDDDFDVLKDDETPEGNKP